MTEITSGVTSSGLTVSAGNPLTVDFGGSSLGTKVQNGGIEMIAGFTSGDVIHIGGSAVIEDGGVASNLTVAKSVSALITVDAGGEVDQMMLEGHAFDQGFVSSGNVIAGGRLYVEAGGLAEAVQLDDEGHVLIQRGGRASALVMRGGGIGVYAGGITSNDSITAAGAETVYAFGRASGSVVANRGAQVVRAHGVAVDTTISAGGDLSVSGGGREVGLIMSAGVATISAGGSLLGASMFGGALSAVAGSTVSGHLILAAGHMTIDGDAASDTLVSIRSGTLELGDIPAFAGDIAGLRGADQKLDLDGFGFAVGETAAWAQSGTSGTLTVTDGARVANLTLVGTYSSNSFSLADDGQGGTVVTHLFNQAAAAFHDRGAPLVHAGGTASSAPVSVIAVATSGR